MSSLRPSMTKGSHLKKKTASLLKKNLLGCESFFLFFLKSFGWGWGGGSLHMKANADSGRSDSPETLKINEI